MALVFEIGKPLPRHELYDEQARARAFWRWSDRARHNYAAGVDASGRQILQQHERETENRHLRRRNQAIVRPSTRSIINRYNDHVCRIEATRPEAVGAYGIVFTDATGSGTPLPTLMRRALRRAQVQGCAYLLADSSASGVFPTAAAAEAAGKRPILRLVEPDQVLWWSDWQGEVVEALVIFVDQNGAPFGWHVTNKVVQRIDLRVENNGQPVVLSIGPELPHKYGGCPLVRLAPDLSGEDEPDCIGESSQAAPIAESQKRICNLDSLLLEEIQGITFTTTVLLGVAAEQVKEVEVGPGKALCLPGGTGSPPGVSKISADTAQAESIRKSLAYEFGELYRAAGLAPGNPTEAGQPESGVARAFAFNEVEAALAGLADAAERAENLAVKRLAADAGFAYPGDAEWPDDFAPADVAADLEFTIRVLTSPLPEVLKDEQVRRFAGAAYALKPEQIAELDAQLEKQDEPPEPGSPLGPIIAGRKAGT